MKIKQIIFVALATLIAVFATAHADTIYSLPQWLLYNGFLKPVVTSSTLQVPSLATSTSNTCVSTNASGTFSLIPCGSGGGGSTTNVFAGTGISVQQVGANATVTNIGVLSVNGATGTVSVSGSFTTTTIAGLVDTVFRVATSGTCFTFSTSSAPSTLTFGWTNCNGYISTSTFNATGSPLYFPYWSSSGNLLTATSNIYAYNATNTGITNYLVVGAASTSDATPENLDVVGTFAVEQPPGNDFFIVNSNGYVGIGSSTPNAPFVFENTSTIPDQFQIVTVNTPHAMLIYNASTTSGGAHISFGNADTGISNANTPDMGITSGGNLYYETYMPNDQVWFTSSTERLRLTSNGNLGIGLTNPAYALDMAAGDAYGYNGTVMAQASTTLFNYFLGGAGTIGAAAAGTRNTGTGYQALSNLTTGGNNTANGYASLYSNTTGNNNTANGYASLYYNTTGGQNTANGLDSLSNNTTGNNNTANGFYSLNNNTTNIATLGAITGGSGYTPGTYTGVQMTLSSGSSATTYPIATIIASSTGAITSVVITTNGLGFKDTTTFLTAPTSSLGGTGSGFKVAVASLSTGQNNTAYGYNSGRFTYGGIGFNETSTNSTYIGYNAYPLASGDTNETVIGYGAAGSGSNTVTLGGTGTTGTIIPYGNVGIGTTQPSSTLHVVGGVTVTGSSTLVVGTTTQPSSANSVVVQGQISSFLLNATSTSAITTIDFSKAERQFITIATTTTTVYLSNGVNGGTDQLKICQDGAGSRSYSFVASSTNMTSTIAWASSTVPTFSTAANACDIISCTAFPMSTNNASSAFNCEAGTGFPF